MDAPALVDKACSQTGLDDFGDPAWREGLDVLVSSLRSEARLNSVGQEVMCGQILRALTNRLQVVAWHAAHPEVRLRPVQRPLFVIGLPRTGTTLLSYLLAQDRLRRSLLRWEARSSVPPPEPGVIGDDPRLSAQRNMDERFHALAPRLQAIHHEEPDGPTECQVVLAQDFRSAIWTVMANVPSYHEWMAACDHFSAYAYHRSVLQLLQWRMPGSWSLKAPQHCWNLDALTTVYPDARFVMTHRDPVAAVASTCSLVRAFTGLFSDADHDSYIARRWPETLAEAMRRVAHFRDLNGDEAFHDIAFDDLVADPIGEVRRLYGWLGEELTPDVEARMAIWLSANPNGRHGAHRYSAASMGIDPGAVTAMFGEYTERHLKRG